MTILFLLIETAVPFCFYLVRDLDNRNADSKKYEGNQKHQQQFTIGWDSNVRRRIAIYLGVIYM